MADNLDLNIDNYNISELLNVFKIDYLPDDENIIDNILKKFNKSDINTNIRNFFKNVGMRLKLESRFKKLENKQIIPQNTDLTLNDSRIQQKDFLINKEITDKEKKELNRRRILEDQHTYLCIDSRFRKDFYNTKSNDFIIELPYKFNNVIEIKLMSIELVNAFTTVIVEKDNNLGTIEFQTNQQNKSSRCDNDDAIQYSR